jgi:hypothetical protein
LAWKAVGKYADLTDWAPRMDFSPPWEPPCDPQKTTFAELVARMTTTPHGTALVCAAFANLEILCAWDDDDERTYLVDRTPTEAGFHRVHWFIARYLELDEKCWPSISAFFQRDREEAEVLPAAAPGHLDPLTLSRRSTWLSCALAGVGTGSIEEDTRGVADARSFRAEVELLSEHAHLACYWLLHHFVAGNTDMLASAMERSKQSAHPWVLEIRELLTRAGAEGPLRIGALDDDYLEEFAQSAPDRAFAV